MGILIPICTVLAVLISLAWYLPCVRAQGQHRVVQRKEHLRTFFLYGVLFSCCLIIVTELIFDAVMKHIPITGLPKGILESFFRAALLEELFKFLGFRLAKRKLAQQTKTGYILTAGMIGVAYSVVEKAVLGNIASILVGLAIPMHITWQLNQGGHFYEYEQHRAAGRKPQARRELFMALAVPFLFHGTWDSLLELMAYLVEKETVLPQIIGFVLLLATVTLGIIYTIRTIRNVRRIIASECDGGKPL